MASQPGLAKVHPRSLNRDVKALPEKGQIHAQASGKKRVTAEE